MGIYYPQGIVTLRMRFEDFGDKENPLYKKEYTVRTFAKNLRVSLNDYTKADTFDMSLDYKQFPFDPRLLRACGVTIHLEDRKKLFTNAANEEESKLNEIKPNDDNIIFVGFADADNIELTSGDRTVRIEGRDYTALLIDLPYLGGPVNLSLPIDQVLQQILEFDERTKNIKVEKRLKEDEVIPTLAELGTDLSAMAGTKNAQKDDSYWEILQRVVQDAGLIAFIELDKLILTKPRNLYDRKKAKIFAFGRNVKDLKFQRKLGRQKGFNVRVASIDLRNKSLIEAKIPEEATAEWAQEIGIKREPVKVPKPIAFQLAPTGTTEQTNPQQGPQEETAPYFTFRLANIVDKEHLISVGEKIFEEMGRQQIEGSFETHEMLIADNQGSSFNVMQMRIGTPLEIMIDGSDLEAIKLIAKNIGNDVAVDDLRVKGKAKRFLLSQGYSDTVAEIIALNLAKIDTPFFTKEIEFMLDHNSGFTMRVDFINFITLPRSLGGQ